jgi:hypothetical protein
MRSLLWVGEIFNTKYTTAPSFYGNHNSVCTKHKAVICSQATRRKKHSHVVLWQTRCQISGMYFFLHFIIAFPSFCTLCPVLLSFIYFSFSLLRLVFFFLFPSFHMCFLLSFFLHSFLLTYYVHLLFFTIPIPSLLSYFLFIYSFTVMSNTKAEMFKLESHS